MAEIIWTKLALRDAEDIHDYIAKDSELYGKKTVEKFFQRVKLLIEIPNAGRIVPEFNKVHIRELIEGNYRIIYINQKNVISIVRIHHAARRITKATKLK